MSLKRRLSIVAVTVALAGLGASPAVGSPPEDDGGGTRIALNGTQRTGVRDSHDR